MSNSYIRPSKASRLPPIDGFDDVDRIADGLADTWKAYDGAKLKTSINTALALKTLFRTR